MTVCSQLRFQLHAQKDLAGLHGDAVVAHMDVHADDADILAALGVDAVGVGGVVGVVDVEVQQIKVLDKDGVDGPRVAVLYRDAVEADVLACPPWRRRGAAMRSA